MLLKWYLNSDKAFIPLEGRERIKVHQSGRHWFFSLSNIWSFFSLFHIVLPLRILLITRNPRKATELLNTLDLFLFFLLIVLRYVWYVEKKFLIMIFFYLMAEIPWEWANSLASILLKHYFQFSFKRELNIKAVYKFKYFRDVWRYKKYSRWIW